MAESRPRGVRLSDLDRSRVYRIGYVGRRWEVLGAEAVPGPDGSTDREPQRGPAASEASRPSAPPVGRHAAPVTAPDHSVTNPNPRPLPAPR